MPFITLISDWQQGDYYLAAVKGKLYSLVPDLTLIDISHKVKSFNTRMAAFILRHSYRAFPAGTVHLVCINTFVGAESSHVAIFHKGHFFVGADNGIFPLIFDDTVEKAVYIEHSLSTTFPEYDILAEAAAFLANGGNIEELGEPYVFRSAPRLLPTFHENAITGRVVYVDSYGNLISNISKDYFVQRIKDKPFEILVDWGYYKIKTISNRYDEVPQGELVALFNSIGFLEIGLVGGSASEILNIHEEAEIMVKILKQPDKETDELILR